MHPDPDGHATSSSGLGPVTCLRRFRTVRVFGFDRDAPSAFRADPRDAPVRSLLDFRSDLAGCGQAPIVLSAASQGG